MVKKRRLLDEYQFPGVRPRSAIQGMFGDPKARIIRLNRSEKKTACGCCGTVHRSYYDKTVRRIRDLSCGDARIYLDVEVRRVRCKRCGTVKREKLPWLGGQNFFY